jgi:hypothetical protein
VSVEADHDKLICDDETTLAFRDPGVDGAVVSVVVGGVVAFGAVQTGELLPPFIP